MTPTDDDYIKELIRRALAPVLNRLAELERQVNPAKAGSAKPKQNETTFPKRKKKLPGAVINDRAEKQRRQEG